ncbi:hypothetical protein Q3G72_018367 [Acer saccharum]|nr:hypothetical protein Q3G72_018367 [Acer saccharum]
MNRGVVGFGLVVRDFGGVVLASFVQHIQVNFSPLIAEAMTILRGINLAFDSNLIPFVIKTDALAVVKLIEAKSPSLADIGLVIGEIVSKLDSIGCFHVHLALASRDILVHAPAEAIGASAEFYT